MNFVDLCCGVGGFHMALRRVDKDARVVLASDIDKKCQETYKHNYGVDVQGDFTKLPLDTFPPFDGLCAGFPCQPFSLAGKRRGVSDERGTIIFHIIRIIRERRPEWVCLENVKGILSTKIDDELLIVDYITREISSLGYLFHYRVISPHQLGVPQCRDRLIFMFVRSDTYFCNTIFRNVFDTYINKWIRERNIRNCDRSIHHPNENNDRFNIDTKQRKVLEMWNDFVTMEEWMSINNNELVDIYNTFSHSKSRRNFKQFHFFTDFLLYENGTEIPVDSFYASKKNIARSVFETSILWNILYKNHPPLKRLIDTFLNKYKTFIDTLPQLYRYLEYSGGEDYHPDVQFNSMICQFRQSGVRIRKGGTFPTLVSSGPRPILLSEYRYLSDKELARLQSFDDSFIFTDPKSVMKQVGNAVNVEVIESVLSSILYFIRKRRVHKELIDTQKQ